MPTRPHQQKKAVPASAKPLALLWLFSLALLLPFTIFQRSAAAVLKDDSAAAQMPANIPPGQDDSRGPDDPHQPPHQKKAAYATDRLIVKYKDSVEACVHCLLKAHGQLKAATADRSDSLDALHARFKVKAAKPVFRTEEEEAHLPKGRGNGVSFASLKQHDTERFEAVKRKFPQRTKRAPKDAKIPDLHHVYVLELEPGANIDEAVAAFSADPHVEYAQPDYLMEANWIPNDPYYSSSNSWGQGYDDLWGLKKIHAAEAWDITKGEGVVVAVVDTGVDYNHPDIAANIWTNLDEIPGNGVDDDHNGYVDDVRGWDFTTCAYFDEAGNCVQRKTADNNPMDSFGHGTHVAGTITAVGNNDLGIIGVAPNATLMTLQGLNDRQGAGDVTDLARGMVYAAENGADVLNNSWGCSGITCPTNPAAEDAVRTAYGLGLVVVFAAGNDSLDVRYNSPQNMTDPKPIVVAASDGSDTRTWFSNFGSLIDIAAPGGGIDNFSPSRYSPWRNILSLEARNCGSIVCPDYLEVGTHYVRQAGTSMATPHVTGVVALLLAHKPTITPEEVRLELRSSADDVGSPGFDTYTGAGLINAKRALQLVNAGGEGAGVNLAINLPSMDASVNSPDLAVDIIGTATGENFDYYQLSYGRNSGPGVSPTEWTALGGPSFIPVKNGLLGTWPIEGLATDVYFVKLVAISKDGVEFQHTVRVAVESVKPIAGNSSSPNISGKRIVWDDGRNVFSCEYDSRTSRCPETALTTFASPGVTAWHPHISGNRVVWDDTRNYNADIYLYDFETGQERRITTNSAPQTYPHISGDNIVYQDTRNYNGLRPQKEIYLYDLGTGEERRITNQVGDQEFPDISEHYIVWQDNRNGGMDVYLYDLMTNNERRITTATSYRSFPPMFPSISGNYIVWSDSRGDGNLDIYLYDLASGTERRLTSEPWAQLVAKVSGHQIVWADYRNGNADIYLYDLRTSQIRRITSALTAEYLPAISGTLIVWADYRTYSESGNISLYLHNTNGGPILQQLGDQKVLEGVYRSLIIAASDPDDDALTLTARSANGDPLPEGAGFTDHEDGRGTFAWTPAYWQAEDYLVTFTASDGELEDTETITITVTDVPLQVVSMEVSPMTLSPNGDFVVETTTISALFNHATTWQLDIVDASNTVVRSFQGTGAAVSHVWDGLNASGGRVPDGVYTVRLRGADVGPPPVLREQSVHVDTAAPQLTINNPPNGSATTTHTPSFSATLTDAGGLQLAKVFLDDVLVKRIELASPTSTTVTYSQSLADGSHTYRLAGWDYAGLAASVSTTFTVYTSSGGGGSGGSGGGMTCGCFLAGTPITLADGSTAPIEAIRTGDTILAFDEATRAFQPDTVTQTFIHEQIDGYLLVNGALRVTPNHPVFSNGRWVEIGTLKVGDPLLNASGESEPIRSLVYVPDVVRVYNFEVNPYHTYVAGGIVAHNKAAVPCVN